MPFPLSFVPKLAYSGPNKGRRYFGAPRDNHTRKHAGCDLIAPLGTDVFAVADGTVYEFSPAFHNGTAAIAVQHPNLPGMKEGSYIVRYCEVLDGKKDSAYFGNLRLGDKVVAGQTIAKVGKMLVDSMLHFELYSGDVTEKSRLSAPKGKLDTSKYDEKFKRRKDLMDPTQLLDDLAGDLVMVFTLAETGRV
ncbi:MAG TPA: M23 family metallopeptidase [Polyangiales bacterium]|nr:M23 family metallopeptidase [Polyangiales bacterium]